MINKLIRGSILVFSLFIVGQAQAVLLFSEYVEGSSYNKSLEIYNTGPTLDFGTSYFAIEIYSNGSVTASRIINLDGLIDADSVFVLSHTRANAEIVGVSDLLSSSLSFNGDDAIVLKQNDIVIDSIGQIGMDPGAEWGAGLTSTQNNTLRRMPSIQNPDPNPLDFFDPTLEWDGFANDDFSGLGQHSILLSSIPPEGSVSVPAPNSFILMALGLLVMFLLFVVQKNHALKQDSDLLNV